MPSPASQLTCSCPYPTCQGVSARHLASSIYLCETCSRLAVQCADPNCLVLNRPLARYCRRCGGELYRDDLPLDGTTIPSADRWQHASRFNRAWQFRRRETGEVAASGPELVAELQSLGDAYRAPWAGQLIEWRFVDGLLAIHQGGAYMAVVHPFEGKPGEPATVLWSGADTASAASGMAMDEGTSRPYPPVLTAAGYLIFSTRYSAMVLDLYGLRGWHYQLGADVPRALFDYASCSELQIAAPPIPLGARSDQVGLILCNPRARPQPQYFWSVQSIAADNAGAKAPSAECRLPLKGFPCQCRSIADQALAISTPNEHWLWRYSDAVRSDVAAMKQTWPKAKSRGRLILDKDVEDPGSLSWARQHVLLSGRPVGRPSGFEWYYQREEGDNRYFDWYHVDLADLVAQDPISCGGVVPIGTWLSPCRQREMLAIALGSAGRNSALYSRPQGLIELNPVATVLLPERNQIEGLSVCDPLVVLVVSDASVQGGRSILIYTLQAREAPMEVGGLDLAADPLLWSRWLFTCERNGRNVSVFRREIPIVPAP